MNSLLAVVSVSTITPGRLTAIIAALLALTGVIVGTMALRRSGDARRRAILASTFGPLGMILGAFVVVTAKGGLGTGNGLGGGVVAMVIGLIAVTLGGWTMARLRRAA